jgi:hypothetical protein
VFYSIVLIIWTALHVYVFRRAATVPLIARHVRRGALAGLAVFLWSVFPLSHSLGDSSVGAIARVLALVGASWVGVVFLLFITMLAADVISAFGLLFRRAAPVLRGWALLGGAPSR